MTENLMNNNCVTLIGKVIKDPIFSHEVYGEGFLRRCFRLTA